jgi:crotonobetainyl-CoA:carnitine CoA-transferase CaiB-like acyl-CoA transferase
MYETKDGGKFYHTHGSLDATRTLNMIGLPAFMPKLTEYRQCIEKIEGAVRRFTVAELESMNLRARQAGAPVLDAGEFLNTPHGRDVSKLPPFTLFSVESDTPPVPFGDHQGRPPALRDTPGSPIQCLKGIRVVELCRVIAGPTIGRSLAAHGAQVLKVTSPHLPDVPFFQVDVNVGKHTTSLHLLNADDRRTFDALLCTADVIIDGYRPGTLDHLGYGPAYLAETARLRGKGIVYVAEDCFGGSDLSGEHGGPSAEWARRPGWQQIADCVTGVAWEQGKFMQLDEPVVPPFPMSDYGTGALGCVAALTGLYRRATVGGSWVCRTSLVQFDLFLLSLGVLPDHVQKQLRDSHAAEFFELRHNDSVDEVGKRALKSVRKVHPWLFGAHMMNKAYSEGYAAEVMWPKEAVAVDGLHIGHSRATRPNGFDMPTWDDWEGEFDAEGGRKGWRTGTGEK